MPVVDQLSGLAAQAAMFALAMVLASESYGQNTIVVNADLGRDTVSRHIYGHFSEHLGRCIYGGYYVGEGNTAVPNTRGIRTDVVEALRKLKIPNLRWPGASLPIRIIGRMESVRKPGGPPWSIAGGAA